MQISYCVHVTSSNTRDRAWIAITTNLSWAFLKTELWCRFPPAFTDRLIKQNDQHSASKCNEAVQHHLCNSDIKAMLLCTSKWDHCLVSMNILTYNRYKKGLKMSVLVVHHAQRSTCDYKWIVHRITEMISSIGSSDEHAKHCSSHDYGAWYASNPLVDEEKYILSQSVNLPLEAEIDSTIDVDLMVAINPAYHFDSNIIRQLC